MLQINENTIDNIGLSNTVSYILLFLGRELDNVYLLHVTAILSIGSLGYSVYIAILNSKFKNDKLMKKCFIQSITSILVNIIIIGIYIYLIK